MNDEGNNGGTKKREESRENIVSFFHSKRLNVFNLNAVWYNIVFVTMRHFRNNYIQTN